MFEPVRGGTRGGQAEFKWSDVSADKDREHYLGHSINAPTGRWQKNKDVHWYSRDDKNEKDSRAEEIRHIKQLEADALAVALGFDPAPKDSNQIPSSSGNQEQTETDEMAFERARLKEERRRRKAERREEKETRRQAKLERKAHKPEDLNRHYRRARDRTRSRSPRRQKSPPSPNSRTFHLPQGRMGDGYGSEERERERERDRRRWVLNSRRELPSNRR